MANDRSRDLIEDIVEGIAHGDVADAVSAFSIHRRDESSVVIDLGDSTAVYVVNVIKEQRLD